MNVADYILYSSDTASTPPDAEQAPQLPPPPPTATFSLPQKRRSPSPPTDYANAPSAVKVVDTSTLDLTRSTVVEGNGTEVPQSEETTASGTNEQAVTEQTETAALEGKDTVAPVSSEATAADDTNGTNAPNSTIENGRKIAQMRPRSVPNKVGVFSSTPFTLENQFDIEDDEDWRDKDDQVRKRKRY